MPSDISSPWLSRGMGRWNDQPSPTSSTHSSPKSPQLALPDLNPRPLDRNLKGKRKAGTEQHSSLFGTRQSTSMIPREQTEGWHRARESVSQALGNFLTQDQLAAHNLRDIVSDSVKAIPIQYTALQIAADLLLSIWDGVQEVEFNRLSSLRLTERSANILHALIQELLEVGFDVSDAIARPMEKLIEALTHVRDMLRTLVHQPFLKRYLKRDETLREIMSCDSLLSDALEMFSLSLQIRVLKQIQTLNTGPHRELETHELEPLDTDGDQATRMDNDTLLDQLAVIIEQMSDGPSVEEFPGVLPLIDRIQSTESESDAEKDGAALREIFDLLQSKQNKLDLVNDTADLRAVVQTALTQNSDVEMLRMLQLNREDLPEVMKILQRAVDDVQRLVKDGEAPPAYTPGAAPPQYAVSILDQKLIVGVRDALRRVSEASAPTEPSWTISRYDVSREDKIGVSFFADVYKGTCRGRAAAIKYVTEETPQTLFEEAVDSWKDLKHPHVLELLGANAESGGGRLFFVYPYKPHGSLDAFLRRVAEAEEAARSGREGELVRYMHEIAQGMQYLHEHGVVHGDLKAANILVDDSFHCVVADFGQNAMKAAVALSSNVPPPHGTLRWRAPELLLGSSELTPATDVYAYAMCCVEILSWGRLPWPLIGDDGVLDLVLREKRRPDIPSTHFDDLPLPELVQACWVDDPVARPPFCQIVEDTEELCTIAEIAVEYPPSQASSRAPSPHLAKVPESPNPAPTSRQGTLSSRSTSGASSLFELGSAPGIASAKDVNSGGYESPTSDKRLTEIREERRYRMLLVHNFHPSLTLPLWNPVHVAIGDVGFFDRESNRFMTLFNCFSPDEAPEGDSQIPSVHEYGQVKTGSQRQNTRSAVQRGLDVLAGRFSLKKDDETASPTVSRRYSYPLRAGHKAAYLCTETTNYRYMEELKAPKEWFKANVDSILHQYGRLHEVVKEDLRLVVGTLDTPDYALFVSHNHPDGEVHFNVFSSTKSGKPWGAFTTEVKEQGGSSYQNSANKSMLFSCKVSPTGGPWNTVLLASLSFKHDVMEPTTLGHAVGSARFLARQKVPTVQPILSSVAKATTSEVDQATAGSSRLPTTSHFPIIYPAPAVARPSNDLTAFRSGDTVALERELSTGGVVVSVHSARDAVAWVEAHYDDPLLSTLRARSFEGPIAIPLSADESALAIFGSIADALVPQLAKKLAEVSGFAVMVRSIVDNPLLSLQSPADSTPSQSVSGDISTGKAARLRGGADDDDETPEWEGKYHNTTVDLRLKVNDEVAYDVNVSSFIKFKTQSLANSSSAIGPPPEVLSLVSLRVKLRRGETMLDRSFSNIGFLVHRPNSIMICDFLDFGYEPPDTKLKVTSQKSTSTTGGATFGLTAVVPSFTATGGYTRGGAESVEVADEKPMPRCNIRYDPGKSWDREEAQKVGKDFQSYDVSWLPATDREKVAYEMRVEFGLAMHMRKNKLRHGPGLPPISSILRNQIVIWVHDPDLRSKARGVLLLTSTYIPNVRTDERLSIYENTTANLNAQWSQDTPVAEPVEEPYDAATSVSVAALDKSKKRSSMVGKIFDKLSFKSAAGKTSTAELPMYETVSRGWDTSNKRWKNVLWPTLDQDFQRVNNKQEGAAWKLVWSTNTDPPAPAPVPPIPTVTVSQPAAIPHHNEPRVSSASTTTTDTSGIASTNIFDPDEAVTASTSLASSSRTDMKNSVPVP